MEVPIRSRRISPPALCALCYTVLLGTLVAVHFPYATDEDIRSNLPDPSAVSFYEQAYAHSSEQLTEEKEREEVYVRTARQAAEAADVQGMIKRFVKEHALERKRVLEVGAGRGYLQDIVQDYTGLDISPTAERFFHKRFVRGSATALPFPDHEFDAVWTVWVLEHVPHPEQALREMRRVVKPGGVILLAPAWFCASWAAEGYEVRPYDNFGNWGKLVKASIPLQSSPVFIMAYTIPVRILRLVTWRIQDLPTRFHYRRLVPNYKVYWGPDSDAVNSMDVFEARLWFESRGDQCLNCRAGLPALLSGPQVLIIERGPSR